MKLHEMVKTISVDDKIGTKMLNSHCAMFKFQELIPVCKKKNKATRTNNSCYVFCKCIRTSNVVLIKRKDKHIRNALTCTFFFDLQYEVT